jgi:hypothetical protein
LRLNHHMFSHAHSALSPHCAPAIFQHPIRTP